MNRHLLFILFWLALFVGYGCQSTRRVPEGQFLLEDNYIKSDNVKIEKDDLKKILKQKPNRKILGLFRFHLSVYNFAANGKETKVRNWLKNTVGEEPVILDTLLTKRSAQQLNLFLYNKGYFNSKVTYDIKLNKKKAKVTYTLNSGEPYKIRKISYDISDKFIKTFVIYDTINSLIKPGNNYEQDQLERERERITKTLKDQGYYFFFKEYIFFEVDSALKSRQVDIVVNIKNAQKKLSEESDSLIDIPHKRFKVHTVYINADYNIKNDLSMQDTAIINEYRYIYTGFYKFNPDAVIQKLFIKKNDYYRISNVEDSYKKLGELKVFKFINIFFKESKTDSTDNYLDCFINLTPVPRESFSIETEGTHSSGNLGISGNFTFQNRNAFRGAEVFELRLKGGIEAQRLVSEEEVETDKLIPFNTIELGPELSLAFPRLFVPFLNPQVSKRSSAKTNLSASYNFQQRPDYTRTIANLSFGYTWRETAFKRHIITPLDINVVKIFNLSENFREIQDVLIRNSYSDQLLAALRYSYVYSNQVLNVKKNFSFFRFDVESAGNLLYLGRNLWADYDTVNSGQYSIFNIKFAQYLKFDVDYRRYFSLNEISTLVLRTAVGVGVPYKNSVALPFVKSYYGGGANDIRAWKARTLGPGGLPDEYRKGVEQVGDIKFIANAEYRFDIYKMLKAAIFYDMGNVWLINADSTKRPFGEFDKKRFYNEIAMGAGVGLRVDFSFFIIRLDVATPIKDPALPKGFRWVIKNPKIKDLNFNLGIGYPF